jgi:hypothetical protein
VLVRRVALALAVLLLAGCSDNPNESEQYRSKITVDGFRHVGDSYDKSASAYYVGPQGTDLAKAITGPDLKVKMDDSPSTIGAFTTVATATGNGCNVLIRTVTGTGAANFLANHGKLTDTDRTGLTAGTLIGLEIDTICKPQSDT